MALTMALAPVVDVAELPTVQDGSAAAQALFHAWRGAPAVVVEGAVGCGKTDLIVTVAAHLARRANLRVAVAAPTRPLAIELANRIAAYGVQVNLVASARDKVGTGQNAYYRRPSGLLPGVTYRSAHAANSASAMVQVAATATWRKHATTSISDVLLLDEAGQCTWGQLREIAGVAAQLLLVTDPAHLPPAIAPAPERWTEADDPHLRASDALRALGRDEVVEVRLAHVQRSGSRTAAALAPLYPFPLTADPANVVVVDGRPQPEIAQRIVHATWEHDSALYVTAAREAARLASGTMPTETDHVPPRVAIIVTDDISAAAMRAHLPQHPTMTVETIEHIQGKEFDATVVIDPMAGRPRTDGGALTPGWLAIALSRHTAACLLVTTADTLATLERAGLEGDTLAGVEAAVRRAIPVTGGAA